MTLGRPESKKVSPGMWIAYILLNLKTLWKSNFIVTIKKNVTIKLYFQSFFFFTVTVTVVLIICDAKKKQKQKKHRIELFKQLMIITKK